MQGSAGRLSQCSLDYIAVLFPMFLIIGVWGSRERKTRAAYQIFLYTNWMDKIAHHWCVRTLKWSLHARGRTVCDYGSDEFPVGHIGQDSHPLHQDGHKECCNCIHNEVQSSRQSIGEVVMHGPAYD